MKHLKGYQAFAEKFTIDQGDPENIKKQKMYINETEIFLRNYTRDKDKLKRVWTATKSDGGKTVLEYEGERALAESDKLVLTTVPNSAIKVKNPYLDEYSNILRIERDIIKNQIGISEESANESETKGKMQGEENVDIKKRLQEELGKISDRKKDKEDRIRTLKAELDKKNKVFLKRMEDTKKDLALSASVIRSEEMKK